MKNSKVIIICLLLLLIGSIILLINCRNSKSLERTEKDFRSTPKTLTSIDAAKYLATKFIKENSTEGLQFRLEEGKTLKNWISFQAIPLNVETDIATIYLSNNDNTWTVRGFGTIPPFEEKDYPF